MKITDMLKTCDALFPNEFSFGEKLLWCDELGALLTREHLKKHRIIGPQIKNGRYYLPQGMELCEVDRLLVGGRLIKKSDANRAGIYFVQDENGIAAKGSAMSAEVKFLCRPMYKRIRNVSLRGAKMSIEKNVVVLPESPFESGDVLLFEFGGDSYKATVGDTKTNGDLSVSLVLDTDTLPQGNVCGDIKRVITDETVCDVPFDAMYYDFINAKICFYQRDYDSYNHHMALFNSRLEDFDRYMIKNTPALKDCRVSNWWN